MVVGGPYRAGQSFQRQPAFSTCRMPLITRRSSTRRAPGWFFGRCGSIAAHASSLNQNRPLIPASGMKLEGRESDLLSQFKHLIGF